MWDHYLGALPCYIFVCITIIAKTRKNLMQTDSLVLIKDTSILSPQWIWILLPLFLWHSLQTNKIEFWQQWDCWQQAIIMVSFHANNKALTEIKSFVFFICSHYTLFQQLQCAKWVLFGVLGCVVGWEWDFLNNL